MKKLSIVLGIIVAVITIFTATVKLDGRWAKAKDFNELNIELKHTQTRLEQKIQEDRSYNIQERLWKLEDRYGYNEEEMPPEIRDQYRRLKDDKDKIDKELNQLNQPSE